MVGMYREKEEWFNDIRNDFAVHSAFVPLDEEDLDSALSQALDLWNQYLPLYYARSVRVPNGLLVIDLSEEENVQGVGHYRYTDSTVDINRTLTPFYPIQILSMSVQGPRFQFETNMTIERWARLLGGKEDQIYDPNTMRLFVWNPRGQSNFHFNVLKNTTLAEVHPHRYHLFRKILRMYARRQMIQTFQRLGPMAGPDGNIETDMEQQQTLYEKEMEEVIPVLERMPESMAAPRWD